MSNPEIGRITCPACDHEDASLRMSNAKSPKPYILCEECGYQGFARGAKAAAAILKKSRMNTPPPEARSPEPEKAPVRARDTKKPAPAAPQPQPKKASFIDEFFGL